MTTPVEPLPEKASPISAIVWTVIALLFTCLGIGGVGLGISEGEEEGMVATIIASFPLGFVWSGSLAAIITYFLKKLSPAVRLGAPFGCGCLGGGGLFIVIAVFFAVIFPEL